MRRTVPPPRRISEAQTGAALFVSLVFLLVLTLIGITGTQIASLQEKMASNLRDRNLAFQAAETALRTAEQYIYGNNVLTLNCASDSDGLYHHYCPTDNGWPSSAPTHAFPADNEKFWSGNTDVITYSGFQGVAAQPQYVVEELPPPSQIRAGSALEVHVYRATARGVGGTTSAVVILQSVFKK